MKKTILMTGGAGFLGSHLCKKYLDEGHRVICVDNLQTTIVPKNIEPFLKNKNFKFIKHDIVKPLDIGEKIDWIFNLACSGSYTIYQYNPVHTMETNTTGMINMLNLARRNGARIMQFSTSEIYGDPLESPQREDYRGNVNSLGPRACYDEGKRSAETLCMDYYREFGTDVKIIRIFNTYGPNMDMNDGRAMSNFIANALAGKDLVIYGDGTNTRSFQYVDDLVEGIDKMMVKDGFIGPVNLGNPGEVTMKDLAEMIVGKVGSSSKIIYEAAASDDPKRRSPDISLAGKELGWAPKISLSEGLDKTIAYFKTIPQPESRILVFSTTYSPDLGPAEQAIFDLSKEMKDTEFHVITTKFRSGIPSLEKINNNFIYRIGFGNKFDKYLLPVVAPFKAYSLNKKYGFKFAWSIMASYAGLSALISKILLGKISFLITLSEGEVSSPISRLISKSADSVFVSNLEEEREAKIVSPGMKVSTRATDGRAFVDQVRYHYADLLNKQGSRLARPK